MGAFLRGGKLSSVLRPRSVRGKIVAGVAVLVSATAATTAGLGLTGTANAAPSDVVGYLDVATTNGNVNSRRDIDIQGWAMDLRSTSTSIKMTLRVDVTDVTTFYTYVNRPDVNAAYGVGGVHGYHAGWTLGPGPHRVCLIANSIYGYRYTRGCANV